jgi:hypothetical protein
VYIRTLKDGVSDDQYVEAWMPEGVDRDDYPAHVSLSHSTANERETVTVFEFEGDPERVLDSLDALVRADWRDRVAPLIEGTDVETIYVQTLAYGSVGAPARS